MFVWSNIPNVWLSELVQAGWLATHGHLLIAIKEIGDMISLAVMLHFGAKG